MSTAPKRFFPCALLAASMVLPLQGCNTSPRFDAHFGDAVRANLAAQVIDPAASKNAAPATGIDGAAARAGQERYQRSFKDADASQERSLVGASGAR